MPDERQKFGSEDRKLKRVQAKLDEVMMRLELAEDRLEKNPIIDSPPAASLSSGH